MSNLRSTCYFFQAWFENSEDDVEEEEEEEGGLRGWGAAPVPWCSQAGVTGGRGGRKGGGRGANSPASARHCVLAHKLHPTLQPEPKADRCPSQAQRPDGKKSSCFPPRASEHNTLLSLSLPALSAAASPSRDDKKPHERPKKGREREERGREDGGLLLYLSIRLSNIKHFIKLDSDQCWDVTELIQLPSRGSATSGSDFTAARLRGRCTLQRNPLLLFVFTHCDQTSSAPRMMMIV